MRFQALLLLPLAAVSFAQSTLEPETVRTAQETRQVAPLTLEQAGGRGDSPNLRPSTPPFRWAWDGEHIVVGRGDDERWIDPRTGADVKPLPEPAEQGAEGGAPTGARDGEGRGRRRRGTSRPDRELEDSSPDGRFVGFVRGNDLYIATASAAATSGAEGGATTGAEPAREVRITSNGGENRFNGKLDWVYQEEIYGRGDFKAFWWSPDSKHVAFLSLDEGDVHSYTVIDHIEEGHFRVKPEVTKYPKVGDPNPRVQLGITDLEGRVVWADLAEYAEWEPLVVRVDWDPKGARCLISVQDRIQQWSHLLAVDPETAATKRLIEERSDSWTERPDSPRWLADGTFLWRSHRTGRDHFYRYSADGELLGAVTKGDWCVLDVDAIDEPKGLMWFSATIDGDVNDNLYRIGLDGEGLVRLTTGDGSHAWDWNAGRTMFLDRVSSLASPGEVRVVDAEGRTLRTLAHATVPGAEGRELARWELHRVAARDGYELDAAVQYPIGFDPARSYPVWISTYSGPAAPSVRNRWSGSTRWQFFAEQGVIVLQANVRTSTRRGQVDTAASYRRLGLQEVEDMSDVVRWFTAHPWADAERVGITGYSFGGTMTAQCLLRTDLFVLGVAGGGVYDWRMYDTIYTERYMATPATNKAGYDDTSCLLRAKDLRGFLHMHHGVMDDNVHLQNMLQFAFALQKAGKTNWSMMAYPESRHGLGDPDQRWHAWASEWALIERYLRPGS